MNGHPQQILIQQADCAIATQVEKKISNVGSRASISHPTDRFAKQATHPMQSTTAQVIICFITRLSAISTSKCLTRRHPYR